MLHSIENDLPWLGTALGGSLEEGGGWKRERPRLCDGVIGETVNVK